VGTCFRGGGLSWLRGAGVAPVTAYLTVIWSPGKRARGFGRIGAAFGLGFIIGPVIGGELGQIGPRVPFYAAALAWLPLFLEYDVIVAYSTDPIWPLLCQLRNFAAYSAALAGYTAAIIASDQLGATGGPNGQAFMQLRRLKQRKCVVGPHAQSHFKHADSAALVQRNHEAKVSRAEVEMKA